MSFALTNAFPVAPMQDKFGQVVFPMQGLSKLEYFALELYKTYCTIAGEELGTMTADKIMATAIHDAEELIELLKEKTQSLQNETANKKPLIEP